MQSTTRFSLVLGILLFGLLGQALGHSSLSSPASSKDAVSDLLKRITKDGDKVDGNVFVQIARIQTEAAFEASVDATKKLKKEPSLNLAYGVFDTYTNSALRRRAIEFLSKDARRHRKKYNQSAAARGLAKFGEEAAKELLLILREHKKEEIRSIVVWPLLNVLAELDSAEGLALMLNNANAADNKRFREITTALGAFKSKASIDAMVLAVTDYEVSLAWRKFLLERLISVNGAAVDECLIKLIGSSDFEQQLLAIETVGQRKLVAAEAELMRQTRGKDPVLVRASIVALAQFVQDSDSWRKTLRLLAKDKRSAARMGAAVGLAALRSTEALELLYGLVADPDHAVRIVAVQEAGNLRRKDVIPLLIARLPKEHGRVQEHVATVLRLITGEDFGTGGRWKSWWADHADGFVIPDYDDALAAENKRRIHERSGGTQASFYGLNIVSKRVCFILDTSGSMEAQTMTEPEGTVSGGRSMSTRIEVAKTQLSKALAGLADEMLFNMIFFSGGTSAWKKGLTEMGKATRAAAQKHVSKQTAGGGTAVYDALILAFEDDRVDTIYLLTDGAPSAGEIIDPDRIAQAIKRLNSTRMIQINCISIGSRSPLLRTLAADSGGTYREVL